MTSTKPSDFIFQPTKPKLRKHTKSRKGCLACKTRKVKCSETFPTCAHCSRLDLDCIYPYTQYTQTVFPTPPSDFERRESSVAAEHDGDDSDMITVAKTGSPAVKSLTDCLVPPSVESREYMAIFESLHFFNNRLLLELTPAHRPFQRTLIDAVQWLSAPRVVQLALVVLTLAVQRSRSCSTPSFDKDVLHYRGTCLSELTDLIKDAKVNRQALTFDCIQLVMLAEMQLEPLGPWAYHLEGTRRLIELQGGLSSFFYQKPALQNLLINYMEIDILTSATCRVTALDEQSIGAQTDYITLLSDREEETITTACFMPVQLLQSTADINRLRLDCPKPDLSPQTAFAIASEFGRIQQTISAFDPSRWASRILSYGTVLPQPASALPSEQDTVAMISLALCHQAAATMYLHLSCNPSPRSKLLNTTHQTLTANLTILTSQISSDTEAPLHTQLYKFAIWPLIVAAYARVGWDLGGDDHDQDLERLRQVAEKIQSRPLAVAAGVMEKVKADRARRGDLGDPWTWDEAFDSRCSFCVL